MEQNNGNRSFDEFEIDNILNSLEQNKAVEEPSVVSAVEEQPLPAENKPKKKKKKSGKKGCAATALWLCIIGILSITFAVLGIFAVSDYLGIGKDFIRMQETRSVQITVEEGAAVSEIAKDLEEQDVLISRHVFLLYLKLTGKGDNINYGAHDFSTKMGYSEILNSLAEPAKAEDVTVTIPSGKTVEEILHILDEAGVCSYTQLRTEALNGTFDSPLVDAIPQTQGMYYSLEGYLFPDTYQFYLNDDPHRVLQKMIDNLEEKFTPEMREKAKNMGYTTHEFLTLASIVEMESCGYFTEMPKVAAVFQNRLNKWPAGSRFLQSDPTMHYPYGNGIYNTYKVEGIPAGPMCSITKEALDGTLNYDTSVTAFYFVTDANSAFYYNDTLAGHDSTIADLKQKGIWISSPIVE